MSKPWNEWFFRPLNIREIKEEAKDIVYIDEINQECTLLCPPGKQNGSARKSITFVFDRYVRRYLCLSDYQMEKFRCYNTLTNTAQVYNEIPYSLVQVCQKSFTIENYIYSLIEFSWGVQRHNPRLWPNGIRKVFHNAGGPWPYW